MEKRNDIKRKREQITKEPDVDETRKVTVNQMDEEEEKVPASPVNNKKKKVNILSTKEGED